MGQQQSYHTSDEIENPHHHHQDIRKLTREIEKTRQELVLAKQRRCVQTKENEKLVKQMDRQIYDLKFRLYRLARNNDKYVSFWEYMKITKQVRSKIPPTTSSTFATGNSSDSNTSSTNTSAETASSSTTSSSTTTSIVRYNPITTLAPFNSYFPLLDTIRLKRVHMAMMQKHQRRLHSGMYKEQCMYLTEQVPIIRSWFDESNSKIRTVISTVLGNNTAYCQIYIKHITVQEQIIEKLKKLQPDMNLDIIIDTLTDTDDFAVEEEARLKVEEEATLKSEEETMLARRKVVVVVEEARPKLEEEEEEETRTAKMKTEEEPQMKAEAEARLAGEEARFSKLKAIEEAALARLKMEEEVRLKSEEEARLPKLKAEEALKKESRLKAEQEMATDEAKLLDDEKDRTTQEEAEFRTKEDVRSLSGTDEKESDSSSRSDSARSMTYEVVDLDGDNTNYESSRDEEIKMIRRKEVASRAKADARALVDIDKENEDTRSRTSLISPRQKRKSIISMTGEVMDLDGDDTYDESNRDEEMKMIRREEVASRAKADARALVEIDKEDDDTRSRTCLISPRQKRKSIISMAGEVMDLDDNDEDEEIPGEEQIEEKMTKTKTKKQSNSNNTSFNLHTTIKCHNHHNVEKRKL